MIDMRKLRVQVREQIGGPGPRVRVEVLDPEGNILGDLANIVPENGITYRFDKSSVSVLAVEFAVERASIDALETAGYNVVVAQHEAISQLRQERLRQGLSLRELAHFAGCSHMTIQRLEVGTLDVAPAVRARIARTLRVSVAELWPDGDTTVQLSDTEASP